MLMIPFSFKNSRTEIKKFFRYAFEWQKNDCVFHDEWLESLVQISMHSSYWRPESTDRGGGRLCWERKPELDKHLEGTWKMVLESLWSPWVFSC